MGGWVAGEIRNKAISASNEAELGNTTALKISESYKEAAERIKDGKNIVEKLEEFKIFSDILLSTIRNSVDGIIKVHPKWASMTLGIMFLL